MTFQNIDKSENEISNMKIEDIIAGTLLGDANIRSNNGKYPCYKLTAKDKTFLEFFAELLKKFGIKSWICKDNKSSGTHALGFYINTCPYPEFKNLQAKWYKRENNRNVKIIPKDLELNQTVILFWYLGDGSLPRRRDDKNRVPPVVLATNSFSEGDIDFLIIKLKELGMLFYPIKSRSGFNKNKECGYVLYSKKEDSTLFRFFKLIGFECPSQIANCSTGRKGRYSEEKFFKGKWPNEDDWIKILSNSPEIGKIIRKRREELNIPRKVLTKLLNVNPDYIRKIESGRRRPSVKMFREVLNSLNINSDYLLKRCSIL